MSRHRLYVAGFLVTAVLLVGVALMGILTGLSALSGSAPASGEYLLLTMLVAAAEWVVAALVLALLATLFLVAAVVSVLRSASLPRDDRLVSLVERLERRYPVLQRFDASEKVEPTVADRREELEQQYVDGELSEEEFERRLAELMEDADRSEAERER